MTHGEWTSETPGDGSLFDSIAELLPTAQRPYYYRRMAHLRQVQPDDDLLQIAEAMGFLALITREAPSEIATERKKIEALLSSGVAEITRALTPAVITDCLRQEFGETKLRETAEILTARAIELAAACSEFTAAVGSLSNPETGATKLITRSLSLMQTELANATQHVRLLTRDLRTEVRSTIGFIAVGAFVVGFLLGVLSTYWLRGS